MHEKIRLKKEVDKGLRKKKEIVKDFGIPANTSSTTYKNLDAIIRNCEASSNSCAKRLKPIKYPVLGKTVIEWLKKTREHNFPVSGPVLQEVAEYFAKQLGYNDFKSSVGWLDKIRLRHDIVYISGCGGTVIVSLSEDGDSWVKTNIKHILLNYNECNIFNADETGLFLKCRPGETVTFNGYSCHGGSLLCAVMTCSKDL